MKGSIPFFGISFSRQPHKNPFSLIYNNVGIEKHMPFKPGFFKKTWAREKGRLSSSTFFPNMLTTKKTHPTYMFQEVRINGL